MAIVTGAGRGIGAAAARQLAQDGYRILLTSRTEEELAAVAAELVGDPSPILMPGDFSQPDFVRAVFARAEDLTVLVNNAATLSTDAFAETSLDEWDRVIHLNLRSVFLACQLALKQIKPNGVIINISSLGAIQNTPKFPGLSSYVTSKAGVIGLSEALAAESKSIRVHCLAPGAVDTHLLREAAPDFRTTTQPEDVARLISFLVREPSLHGCIVPLPNREVTHG